ncbi:MAG: non-canonical purine NTP pyrophosphatase [Planctomycetota bacterium]
MLIATGNPGKLAEIRAVLADLGLALTGLDELDSAPPEPVEDGDTFLANATIKARAYALATGMPCLADDSGLIVDALDGRPGVISSHYCTDGRDIGMPRAERDHANSARVLRELGGVADSGRTARFVCVMAIAEPDGTVRATAEGAFEGRIGRPPRVPAGDGGFGYDPIFLAAPEFVQTSAELPASERNARSHRGQALRRLAERLRSGLV